MANWTVDKGRAVRRFAASVTGLAVSTLTQSSLLGFGAQALVNELHRTSELDASNRAEYEARRRDLAELQLKALRYDDREYEELIGIAHAAAGTDQAHLIEVANLDNLEIIRALQERAIYHLRSAADADTANAVATVARLLRFETPRSPQDDFYGEAIKILSGKFPDFCPLLRYRYQEQKIRALGHGASICDELVEIESGFESREDLNCANDARCRIATQVGEVGELDLAENLLLTSISRLQVEGYRTDPRILYVSKFNKEDQEAFLRRALSVVYLRKAVGIGRNNAARVMLGKAVEQNNIAIGIYKSTGALHGLANSYKDRGVIERESVLYGSEVDWAAWFRLAALMFARAGDLFLAKRCEAEAGDLGETVTSQLMRHASGRGSVLRD